MGVEEINQGREQGGSGKNSDQETRWKTYVERKLGECGKNRIGSMVGTDTVLGGSLDVSRDVMMRWSPHISQLRIKCDVISEEGWVGNYLVARKLGKQKGGVTCGSTMFGTVKE